MARPPGLKAFWNLWMQTCPRSNNCIPIQESKMADQNTAAFGIYSDRLSTAHAINTLRDAGFRNGDIVALFPDEVADWQFSRPSHTRAIQGALVGGLCGLVVAGLFAASAYGLSIISVMSGTAFLSLAGGGLFGAGLGLLLGRRLSEYDNRYEGRVRRGAILLSVHGEDADWTDKAVEILKRTGADDVSTSDKLTLDFVRTNRILVRAASERTTAAPLRLVQSRSTRAASAGRRNLP
jgi:hypothetical protein